MCNYKKNFMKATVKILLTLLVFITLNVKSQVESKYKFDTKYSKTISEKLSFPFGTILEMEVKIINGDSLNFKAAKGNYLLQVEKVNNQALTTYYTFFFEDESDQLNKKFLASLNSSKTIKIIAYETGAFRGIPNGYDKYKPMKGGLLYGYQSYLVVLAKK